MTRDQISEAAAIVAQWPGVVARLRAIHVADDEGRCIGCRSQVRPAPKWPCGPAAIVLASRHPST